MKRILFLIYTALLISCKKEGELCATGCYVQPPRFYFVLADSKGKSLFASTTDGISVAYINNGQLLTVSQLNYPQKVLPATATPSADFIVAD